MGLGQHLNGPACGAQALRPHLHLCRRLLAGHQQGGPAGCHVRQRLQHQGALADSRLAPQQHQRTRNQAAAQHAVEFSDSRGDAVLRQGLDLGERSRHGGAHGCRCCAGRLRLRRCELLERVPLAAGRAAAHPASRHVPAAITQELAAGPWRAQLLLRVRVRVGAHGDRLGNFRRGRGLAALHPHLVAVAVGHDDQAFRERATEQLV